MNKQQYLQGTTGFDRRRKSIKPKTSIGKHKSSMDLFSKKSLEEREEYYKNMKRIFGQIQKSKLKRLVEEVCYNNSIFRNYVKNQPSETLTFAEVVDFETNFLKQNILTKSKSNYAKIDI